MKTLAARFVILYLLPIVPLVAYAATDSRSTFGKELRELVTNLFESFVRGRFEV